MWGVDRHEAQVWWENISGLSVGTQGRDFLELRILRLVRSPKGPDAGGTAGPATLPLPVPAVTRKESVHVSTIRSLQLAKTSGLPGAFTITKCHFAPNAGHPPPQGTIPMPGKACPGCTRCSMSSAGGHLEVPSMLSIQKCLA